MQNFPTTPSEILTSAWRHRELIQALTKREVLSRYRGSFLGLLWSFVTPLFMLAVFTFVFSVIFQARWGGSSGSKIEFALLLFVGLLVFNLFAECINRAPALITSNVNYVKKIVFPLEILPLVGMLTGLFHTLIGFSVWMLFYITFLGMPQLTVLYLPLVMMPFCLLLLGLSWILASLGVFLRDVSQLIGVMTTGLMFLSPIFYPVTALPQEYRFYLYLNPITTIVEQARNLLYWGQAPDFLLLGIYWLATLGMAWLGFAWFQRTRKGFADVL